ncbi:MAG: hypothetical protein AAF567_15090 [Actinomycetota bacterium]
MLRQADPTDLETLPSEIRERFPEVVEDLRNGAIDEIPDAVLDQLPDGVVDRIPETLLASDVNITLVVVLAAVALLSLAGFFYGVTKAAMKAALFFLVVGGIAAIILYVQF